MDIKYIISRDQNQSHESAPLSPLKDGELLIVTGAQGALGQCLLESPEIQKFPNRKTVGLHRRPLTGFETGLTNIDYRQVDILNSQGLVKTLEDVITAGHNRITVIHTIGSFKYEPEGTPVYDVDGDGIDDELLASNFTTTKNVVEAVNACLSLAENHPPFRFVGFASIIEEHRFPHFGSYDAAKLLMKKFLREWQQGCPENEVIIFNIPTLNTSKERAIRPYAELTPYWLQPLELVKCINAELSLNEPPRTDGYRECGVIVNWPEFDLGRFKEEHAQRWRRETGYGGRERL